MFLVFQRLYSSSDEIACTVSLDQVAWLDLNMWKLNHFFAGCNGRKRCLLLIIRIGKSKYAKNQVVLTKLEQILGED